MNHKIDQLSVHQYGDNTARPIIFVHGFPYDHTMWEKQTELLSNKYFCVAYDVRGLGQSMAGNGQYTMESFVDDLEMVMNELELKKPVLCGLSMGGYIALRALERGEEKFSAAILCDTKSEADDGAGKLKRAAAIKRINEEGLTGFVNDFVSSCFGDEYKEKFKQKYESMIEKSTSYDPVGVKGSLLAMLSRTDTTDYLGKIKIPTLLICGEHDALTPPPVMKKIAEKIKKSSFVEIKNSGHMTPIEKPKEVTETIQDFIEKLKPVKAT